MFRVVAYGVRENEVEYFKKLNKYDYDLQLESELLTHENIETAKGADAVLLRANCEADDINLAKLNEWGIKYVFTRTVGYNHIDLKAAAKYGMEVARVPAYSPYAVAELAMTLGMMLFRHTALATNMTEQGDFSVSTATFSGEVHSSTVGIVGTGRIGATEAQLYSGMGAKVLGYDPYPSDFAKQYVTFVSQDELLEKSDIVSVHVPYFPGKNDNLIDKGFLAKMKETAVLVNTARSELADYAAIISAVKAGHIAGFASDVLPNEAEVLGHDFKGKITDETTKALVDLYPRVLLTPHIGSYTSPALTDMIAVSYDNFHQAIETGKTDNDVKLD